MKRLSMKLKGYSGANPFRESQARTFGDEKIVNEFYPTSLYWSLFNEQHEILLGTRGSGKTALLRMLQYSLLKRLQNIEAQRIVAEKRFIGFYVPLHLEFLDTLQRKDASIGEKIQYFHFAFNCAAAIKLMEQISELLNDCIPIGDQRIRVESKIVDYLSAIWFPSSKVEANSIDDLKWTINVIYNTCDFPTTFRLDQTNTFSRPLLTPIVAVLPKVTGDLGLDTNKTNWVICIDEAEFLQEPFLKSINTFLRSEKRPLIVKMATLPFKHTTCDTLIDGVYIEPNGSDFNYRKLDMEWDSDDFKGVTDQLCRVRLANCGIYDDNLTLESFLGVEGRDDDLIDYYKLEMGMDEASSEIILNGILESLSNKRRSHYPSVQKEPQKVNRPLLHRFSPVYFMRRMKIEESKGNRTVGWFAGAKVFRRIADGNPRRFIQIMNDVVEKARQAELTPKNQHRILAEFAKRSHDTCEALPVYGLSAAKIIEQIGGLLENRVHGEPMMDGGCNFYLDHKLIDNQLIRDSIELAIAYSYIFTDEDTLFSKIKDASILRLAYMYAVYYWLPMRKGDPPIIRDKHDLLESRSLFINSIPSTPTEADKVFSQLKLEI